MRSLREMTKRLSVRGRMIINAMVGAPTTVELDSSFLKEASYDRHSRSMRVRMISSSQEEKTYEYGCVEPQTFAQLIEAPSAGQFFNTQVRAAHPYREV